MSLTVVSFWTGQPWKNHAAQLVLDCNELGVKHVIEQREDLGSWVVNCGQKPMFIRDTLRLVDGPVLWIDADARIHNPLTLLEDPKEHFAIHAFPGRPTRKPIGREERSLPEGWPAEELGHRWFNTGTVYFRPSQVIDELLNLWCQLAATQTGDWDQWLLQEAWVQLQPETLWLPDTYCAWRRGRSDEKPVIEHLLASTKIPDIDRGA